MPLPTANLTFHIDASVDTDLWQVNTTGVFTVHPTDGQDLNYWDDVEHGAVVAAIDTVDPPDWQSATPLMALPCVSFDGSAQRMRLMLNDDSATSPLSSIITNSAFTILISLYISGGTANNAGPYDNSGVLADNGAAFGIYVKKPSGYKLQFFNDGGGTNLIELDATINTSYVAMFRHESGNIFASLNGGSETSVSSGNTSSVTGVVRFGRNYASTYFNGRIGEIAVYNAALSGSTLTDAITYFTDKWLPAAASGSPFVMQLGAQRF